MIICCCCKIVFLDNETTQCHYSGLENKINPPAAVPCPRNKFWQLQCAIITQVDCYFIFPGEISLQHPHCHQGGLPHSGMHCHVQGCFSTPRACFHVLGCITHQNNLSQLIHKLIVDFVFIPLQNSSSGMPKNIISQG